MAKEFKVPGEISRTKFVHEGVEFLELVYKDRLNTVRKFCRVPFEKTLVDGKKNPMFNSKYALYEYWNV